MKFLIKFSTKKVFPDPASPYIAIILLELFFVVARSKFWSVSRYEKLFISSGASIADLDICCTGDTITISLKTDFVYFAAEGVH